MIAHQSKQFAVISIPDWSVELSDACYYGWRWCLHIGPLLIFFGDSSHKRGGA